MFPAMGRIRGASKLAAANPIRLPECLAIRVHIAIAIMIAINMIPNASLKSEPPFFDSRQYPAIRNNPINRLS